MMDASETLAELLRKWRPPSQALEGRPSAPSPTEEAALRLVLEQRRKKEQEAR